jgi:hypothetical protein
MEEKIKALEKICQKQLQSSLPIEKKNLKKRIHSPFKNDFGYQDNRVP